MGLTFAALAAGCASRPQDQRSAKIDVTWSAYAGTAIGAPTTRPVDPANGWLVHTTLLALPESPGQIFEPLSARGRLFAQAAQGDPVLASPQLTSAARIGGDDAARSWFNARQDPASKTYVGIEESTAVLAEGATLAVRTEIADRFVEIRLHRSGGNTFDLLVAARGAFALSEDAAPDARPIVGRESVLVEAIPLDTAHPIVLILPVTYADTTVRALTVRVDIALPSADEAFEAAAARTREMLARSSAAVEAAPRGLPARIDAWSGYERALGRADAKDHHRAALSYIASQTDGPIAQDLVLVADDATLDEMASRLLEAMAKLNRDPKLLGWQMDLIALQVCADRAGKGTISREMTSLLTIHAGEAGRNTASVADLIKNVTARSELMTRITVENMIYLEDSSPAARVRAYDWLAARGKAPPGFDPLGPPQQRREALERALTPATAPAADAGGTP